MSMNQYWKIFNNPKHYFLEKQTLTDTYHMVILNYFMSNIHCVLWPKCKTKFDKYKLMLKKN